MSLVLLMDDGMDCEWIVDDGGEGETHYMSG